MMKTGDENTALSALATTKSSVSCPIWHQTGSGTPVAVDIPINVSGGTGARSNVVILAPGGSFVVKGVLPGERFR